MAAGAPDLLGVGRPTSGRSGPAFPEAVHCWWHGEPNPFRGVRTYRTGLAPRFADPSADRTIFHTPRQTAAVGRLRAKL